MLEIDLNTEELELKEQEREKNREKRHHRQRIINKRKRIVQRWVMPDFPFIRQPLLEETGRLAKFNLACSCSICRMEKHWGLEKPQNRLFKSDKEEIEEYVMQVSSEEEQQTHIL
jgi:radical SAM superfamily enzyme YgiQ (UPF0313 family)